MISSEVQRTLVKSPPELWAELGDQEALSRHLGALGSLGSLRITRAKPEELVEWEAEGASGSIRIKPSGWGTKVTLSVTRELPAEQAEPPTAAEPGAAPVPAASTELPPAHAREHEPEPPVLLAASEDEPEPAAVGSAAERPPEPEGQDLQSEGHDELESEAHIANEPEDEIAPEPEDEIEHEPQDADEQRTIAFAAISAVEIPEEPRRGFFARLFARLWAKGEEDAQPQAQEAGLAEWEAQAAPADAHATEEVPAEAPGLPEAEAPGLADAGAPRGAIESLQARFVSPEPIAQQADEPGVEQAGEPVAEQVDEAGEPVAEEADEVGEPVAEQPVEDGPAVAAEQPSDLAGELRAAEEVAADEVTAMLTAVLDRLGAAHHRPFSRS